MFQHLRSLSGHTWDKLRAPICSAGDTFDYRKLASACTTENEFNRLHIQLENILTPLELAKIAKLAETNALPKRSLRWLERMRKWNASMFDAPHPYKRRVISEHVNFYQSAEQKIRDKGLLVVFCSIAGRPMMPVGLFLQFVDSRVWDVVMVRKYPQMSVTELDGTPTDVLGFVADIEANFSPSQYRRVFILGTSAGGFPALCTAMVMGADRGISLCGGPPRISSHSINSALGPKKATELWFVYGVGCARDHDSALALKDLCGGRLMAIPEVLKHDFFSRLLKKGGCAEFFDKILN